MPTLFETTAGIVGMALTIYLMSQGPGGLRGLWSKKHGSECEHPNSCHDCKAICVDLETAQLRIGFLEKEVAKVHVVNTEYERDIDALNDQIAGLQNEIRQERRQRDTNAAPVSRVYSVMHNEERTGT